MKIIQIKNLAIGKPKEFDWNDKKGISAIGKTSTETLQLLKSGFVGDDVANHEFHGGFDRAVCLYPFEHYVNWENEFQTKLKLPAFGENMTVAGMLEDQVCIGDVYQAGDAVLQITQGRIPCSTISNYNGVDKFLMRIVATNKTGYFFRVLEEGAISMESTIKLIEKHPMGVTVFSANQVMFHDQKNKKAIGKILQVKELAEVWREKFTRMLQND
jgi:MOSC domain-containing protein YiiM